MLGRLETAIEPLMGCVVGKLATVTVLLTLPGLATVTVPETGTVPTMPTEPIVFEPAGKAGSAETPTAHAPAWLTLPCTVCVVGKLLTLSVPETACVPMMPTFPMLAEPATSEGRITPTVPDTACVAGKLLTARVPETVGVPTMPTDPETACVLGKLLIATALLMATVPDTL